MQQHTFGGGAVGEGHRFEEISKTVTQQSRPQLERQISASHASRRQSFDPTPLVGGTGLAAMGAGAAAAGSGKRRIKRVGAAVDRAKGAAEEASQRSKDARANAHVAFGQQSAAARSHGEAKSRQAALADWEKTGANLPHTTQLVASTGRESAHTIHKPGGLSHTRARNSLANQANRTEKESKAQAALERSENARADQAGKDHARFSQKHREGVAVQRKVVPRMKARIGAGRALMVGGGLAAGAAAVHAERKRVNKSLEGKSLVQIQKALNPRLMKPGGPAALRTGLAGPTGKPSELANRLKGVRPPAKTNAGPQTLGALPGRNKFKVRTALAKPQGTEVNRRLRAARPADAPSPLEAFDRRRVGNTLR